MRELLQIGIDGKSVTAKDLRRSEEGYVNKSKSVQTVLLGAKLERKNSIKEIHWRDLGERLCVS